MMNTTATKPREIDVDRLLNPAGFFAHPMDVVADTALTLVEKRAILSSWASDSCAVESMPSLRQPSTASRAIAFDDIMDALKELDAQDANPPRKSLWRRHRRRTSSAWASEGASS